MDGKARIDQLGRIGAGPGGIERRMFQQPHPLARVPGDDRGGARLHVGQRLRIIDRRGVDAPFDLIGKGEGVDHGASLT